MREVYQEQLGKLADHLAEMSELVAIAMERATKALLETDLPLAESVIEDDIRVDDARASAEEQALGLLALQAPVAGDLRTVIATLHSAEDLERMGDLALHVAKAARRRHPNAVLPPAVQAYFAEMGRIAVKLAGMVGEVIRTQDVALARTLDEEDDAMDDIHRHLFTVLMGPEWEHGVAAAVDVTLLGRFYERFGDHAVSVANRVEFIVTGKMPSA